MIARLSFLLGCLAAAAALAAMEVPLQHGGDKTRKGLVVGFVDMDRVYQEFPETRKARQEYQDQSGKMKQILTDKEAELSDLREQLTVLRAAMEEASSPKASTATSTSAPVSSTATVSPPALSSSTPAATTLNGSSLSDKERSLADQEASLAEAKKGAAQALTDFERKRAGQIFGKLYKSLVQLADEKGVDMVLDKSALLYGQEGLDLTEALSRRVRGLPDEAPQP